jgi:hypothetical protein
MLARSRTPPSTIRRLYCTGLTNTVRTFEKDNRWPGWEVVIGIEVHAQIKSREKLFSRKLLTQTTTPRRADGYDAQMHGHPTLEVRQILVCLLMMLPSQGLCP